MNAAESRYLGLLLDLGPVGVEYSLHNPTEAMPQWAIDLHRVALYILRLP